MKDVLDYLQKLLMPNDIIVVATSGGPDSMCLVHLLCELKKDINIKVIVAHVNHKLRCESEEEALFVKQFAFDNNLTYEYMEIKEYDHDNLENEARIKRYAFFNELINTYHANYLMTAHHGDDLMETILMRLARGSSIKGYSGFKKELDFDNYKLVRPLITKTKDEILKYMDSLNFKYFIDESNKSREYTRNRYRLDVLPFFKKENKNVHLKFLKFSEELTKVNNFIDNYIKELIPSLKIGDNLSITKLNELDSFLLQKVVEYLLSLYYINDLFLVNDKHRDMIIDLIKSSRSNGKLDLPNDLVAIKEYDILKIGNNIKVNNYFLELQDYAKTPNGIIKKIQNSDKKNNFIIRLNSKDLTLPLIVRNRRDGDKMEVKNLKGTKKIKDILIDEKIPKAKRDVMPIVTDSKNNVLWLPGVKKSKFDVETNQIYDIILSYEEE